MSPKPEMCPIDQLNKKVRVVAAKNPKDPTYAAIREPTSAHKSASTSGWSLEAFRLSAVNKGLGPALGLANPTVYVRRFEWLMYLHTLHAVFWIARFIWFEPQGWAKYAATFVAIWAWTDFKGGVLHVVLDNPDNINYPVIGLPSLEFQMHHAIPQDIVIKGFAQACSDLNPIACYGIGWTLYHSGGDPYTMALASTVLLCAYAGQYAHQAAHKLPKQRPTWVTWLQRLGVMVPPEVHHRHHQTHDVDFAILNGWSNPVLRQMLKWLPQRPYGGTWITLFVLCTAFDAFVLTGLLRPLLGVQIA